MTQTFTSYNVTLSESKRYTLMRVRTEKQEAGAFWWMIHSW